MLTGNTQFEYELHKLIDAELQRIEGVLGAGLAVKDIADYREFVGQMNGLKRAKAYCDEVNHTLSER